MKLTILTPIGTVVDREVSKVVAEAPNGFFCLLPRHVDFATAVVPGILAYTTMEGREVFVAVDEGVLVKQSGTVMVSTLNAVTGNERDQLEETVAKQFRERNHREKKTLQALNRIEVNFIRRFLDIQKAG
jgi:F-type H+-transporting ATPase subunit epsilon